MGRINFINLFLPIYIDKNLIVINFSCCFPFSPFEYLFYNFLIHLFTGAYMVWSISYPIPHTNPISPTPLRFQAEHVLPFSPILLKRRHSNNKKDKVFLLVEIRIAIQRDS
jgi:hypothetical protein